MGFAAQTPIRSCESSGVTNIANFYDVAFERQLTTLVAKSDQGGGITGEGTLSSSGAGKAGGLLWNAGEMGHHLNTTRGPISYITLLRVFFSSLPRSHLRHFCSRSPSLLIPMASVSALAGAAAHVVTASAPASLKPAFPAIAAGAGLVASETRTIRCPSHRYTPLKESWDAIVKPIVEHMKLMIRMNTKTRSVELKTSPYTADVGALQKGEDFVRAFMLGFELADAVALLRLDDLYIGEGRAAEREGRLCSGGQRPFSASTPWNLRRCRNF